MKNYRIVEETRECGDKRYAIEYQSLATCHWLHVTYRQNLSLAQDCVKSLKSQETISRKVIEVYNAD